MYNLLKTIVYFSILFIFLQSCSSAHKSGYPANENTQDAEITTDEKEDKEERTPVGSVGEISNELPSKPLKQVFIPEQKFVIEKIIKIEDSKNDSNVSSEYSSENEQLSVSNKHAKVVLFAKKLQKGSYPIAKNSVPYASVHVMLTQGEDKIEGDLEDGTVKLLLLDSAGITKGSFEGTLIKDNERYFIGGNFSN